MAFPTTPILDSFTGANENPITTNWTTPLFTGDGNLKRLSNTLQPATTAAACNGWYDIASYGPDCEAYITCVTRPPTSNSFRVWARVTGEGTATPTGYCVRYERSAGTDFFRIIYVNAGTDNILGADISQELADGDSVGLECIGTSLSAYYKPSAGSWTLLGSRTDSNITGAGKLAFEVNDGIGVASFDDFGGGAVVVAYPIVAWLTA